MNEPHSLTERRERRFSRRWFDNRELQFWTLQLLGWSAWAFTGAVGWAYWMDTDQRRLALLYTLAGIGGIAVTTVLRYVYRALWRRPLTLRIAVALTLSYAMAGVWQAEKNLVVLKLLDEFEPSGWLGIFEGIQVSYYVTLLWSGLYFGIKYYQMLQRETEKVLRVTAMAHQAQLKMLRYQLNPHFLFNTLNAISTLILERDTEHANRMVTALSRFLRYSLDNDPMQRVSLDQELTALELYLDIELARFDERLTVAIDIDATARRALVPSLLLQPIVENAIKYAIAPRESGGTIRIEAAVRGDRLGVSVTDDGPGIADVDRLNLVNGEAAGRGVGLVNTRQRLRELYPHDHSFAIRNAEPRGLQVSLQLPFSTV